MKKMNLFIVLFILFSQVAFAQSKMKIGYINLNELLLLMPERDSALQVLNSYIADLQDQFETMNTELETKKREFEEKKTTMSPLILQTKQRELDELQKRIEEFRTSAQQDLRAKENELLQPLLDKAKKTIAEVAKEKGYTYILDIAVGTVLYSEEENNILPLVKKKLGITK